MMSWGDGEEESVGFGVGGVVYDVYELFLLVVEEIWGGEVEEDMVVEVEEVDGEEGEGWWVVVMEVGILCGVFLYLVVVVFGVV